MQLGKQSDFSSVDDHKSRINAGLQATMACRFRLVRSITGAETGSEYRARRVLERGCDVDRGSDLRVLFENTCEVNLGQYSPTTVLSTQKTLGRWYSTTGFFPILSPAKAVVVGLKRAFCELRKACTPTTVRGKFVSHAHEHALLGDMIYG